MAKKSKQARLYAKQGVPEEKAEAAADVRTSNILKLTQKQLQKAIAKRKQLTAKPVTAKTLKISKKQKEYYDQGKEYQNYLDNLPEGVEPVTADIFADTVISNYRLQIHAYPQYAEPLITEWLDSMIAQYGKEDVALMLQNGAEAGVVVTQAGGDPTGGYNIRIRGVATMDGNTDPLWVVDGIQHGNASNLDWLDPNDVESIEILKDASATAIYGSRGANGVIMVTTKHGKVGRCTGCSGYSGIQLRSIALQIGNVR